MRPGWPDRGKPAGGCLYLCQAPDERVQVQIIVTDGGDSPIRGRETMIDAFLKSDQWRAAAGELGQTYTRLKSTAAATFIPGAYVGQMKMVTLPRVAGEAVVVRLAPIDASGEAIPVSIQPIAGVLCLCGLGCGYGSIADDALLTGRHRPLSSFAADPFMFGQHAAGRWAAYHDGGSPSHLPPMQLGASNVAKLPCGRGLRDRFRFSSKPRPAARTIRFGQRSRLQTCHRLGRRPNGHRRGAAGATARRSRTSPISRATMAVRRRSRRTS